MHFVLVLLAALAASGVTPAAAATPLTKPPNGTAGWSCALLSMPPRMQWANYAG